MNTASGAVAIGTASTGALNPIQSAKTPHALDDALTRRGKHSFQDLIRTVHLALSSNVIRA